MGRMAASTRRKYTGGLNNRGPQQPMMAGGRGSVVTRSRRGMNLTTRDGGMLGRNSLTISMEEDGEDTYALSGGNRERCATTSEPESPRTGRWTAVSPHQNIGSAVSECPKLGYQSK